MSMMQFISAPSTSFISGSSFEMLLGRKCSLSFSYEGEEDSITLEKLVFDEVESFRCTYYKACSIEMMAAYDKVIEVENSEWLTEIKQNLSRASANSDSLKHLRIYFDDGPCYEFICRSFEFMREVKKD